MVKVSFYTPIAPELKAEAWDTAMLRIGGRLRPPRCSPRGADLLQRPQLSHGRTVSEIALVRQLHGATQALNGVKRIDLTIWESPKPLEFGSSGQNWEDIGWRVKVQFTELSNKVRQKDHIDILRPLLPDKYSSLQPNVNGF